MHSIERYGIVALLFLVVTVVAVLMWDGGKDKKKKPDAASAAMTPAAARERPGADERRGARRLSLAAEAQPGPLVRQPDRSAGDAGTGAGASPAGDAAFQTAPLDPGTTPGTTPGSMEGPLAAPRSNSRREEPARDQVVASAQASATHPYAVRQGDTLSEISQRELGSARRWPEIVAANPGLDPARLRAGKTIQIPGAGKVGAAAAQAKPEAAQTQAGQAQGARTWKVAKGENLWRIAERVLGDGKRWPEIAALNPRVKPDRLVLGQVLTLPDATPARSAGKPAKASKPDARPPTQVASTGGERFPQRGGRVR